nr:hypothetical protein [uncultured Brevundimonas sp.]
MIILPGADRISERRDPKPSQKYANPYEPCKQLMLSPPSSRHPGEFFTVKLPSIGLKSLNLFASQQK